jgi:hypothetical protein
MRSNRNTLFLIGSLVALAAVAAAGCSDDDSQGDADVADNGGDVDTGADADADADAEAEADGPPTCDPPCDADACLECVGTTCVTTCESWEGCDGSGTCVAIPQAVGGPCRTDADCDAGGTCLTEFSNGLAGGYCVTACGAEGDCGANLCVSAGSSQFCADACTAPSDCRTGYECISVGAAGSVCWGNCTDDDQCTSTGYCAIEADQGWCSCPAGRHLTEDRDACVVDDCEFLNCPALHRVCDATGGCGGECAACGGCDPDTYVEGGTHCYPPGGVWGGPCETDADCPGTGAPGVDTFCASGGYGNCYQVDGPDYTTPGSPCTGDAGSVGVILTDMFGTEYSVCAAGCATDADCEPGLACVEDASATPILFCWAIGDCATDGCNDPEGGLYCAASGACFEDGCDPNPCTGIVNSTEECFNVAADFRCGCDAGHVWDGEAGTCDAYTCPAVALAPGATRTGVDTCTGTTVYDAGGSGTGSCTGYVTPGQEMVYSVVVPAGSQVTVTVTAPGFDAAIWATTSCEDLIGASCVAGADATTSGAESVSIVNTGAEAATYYVVADAYSGCALVDIAVGTASTITVIGTFAAGAAIPAQTGGPLAAGASDQFLITFSENVLLSGSIVATSGDPDFYLYQGGTMVVRHWAEGTSETWTGDAVAAGTYLIRMNAYSAVPSYTMTLTTTAP